MPHIISSRRIRISLEEWIKRGGAIIEELAKGGEHYNRVTVGDDVVWLDLDKWEQDPEPEKPKTPLERLKEASEKEKALPKYKRK